MTTDGGGNHETDMPAMRQCIKEWLLPYMPCGESMRSRKVIESDGTRTDILALEVLLDMRDLMVKTTKRKPKGGK